MRKPVSLLILIFAVITLGMGFALGADNPKLIIKSPKDGSTVESNSKLGRVVVVQFEVKNFEIKDFTKNTEVKPNEGHIHFQLDSHPYVTHTTDTAFVIGDVKPGLHTLTVELVHNDHTPLEPPVKQVIHFTMEENEICVTAR